VTDPIKPHQPKKLKNLTAEQWFLFAALILACLFACLIIFLFMPLLSRRPLPAQIVAMAATQGFVLPPTWTPTPGGPVFPTPVATPVSDGNLPTRIYTPRATSMPGAPMPIVPPRFSVLDLARIMQGESPGDPAAAYYVGWVAKNRLLNDGNGDTYAVVSHGFFGYRAEMNPYKEFLKIAQQVIRAKEDPTQGCLYALSRTDITHLGVPPSRADVTKGEWFFFRTWPVTSNRRSR
jgi:hypothetical protein